MLARHAHTSFQPVVFEHRFEVGTHDGVLLGKRWVGQLLACPQILDRLIEKPWPPIGAAPDHHTVGA